MHSLFSLGKYVGGGVLNINTLVVYRLSKDIFCNKLLKAIFGSPRRTTTFQTIAEMKESEIQPVSRKAFAELIVTQKTLYIYPSVHNQL